MQSLRRRAAQGHELVVPELNDDADWGSNEPLFPGWTAIVDIGPE